MKAVGHVLERVHGNGVLLVDVVLFVGVSDRGTLGGLGVLLEELGTELEGLKLRGNCAVGSGQRRGRLAVGCE